VARVRKIQRRPPGKNCYLVDANFLANRFIPATIVTDANERVRVERSHAWWSEIDAQLKSGHAFVYVPDLCIAEAFKVLAKKYYVDGYFRRPIDHKNSRDELAEFLHVSPRTLKGARRAIKVHDISTSRDIIIAVDRFNEIFLKHKLSASVVDLVILATAKYLIDFFHIPAKNLYIVTLDNALWRGSKKAADVPSAFNPNVPSETAAKVFV
jgi:predicted nucleic acid-binding protein